MRSFYTGTSGIILRSSTVISRRGTWDFKNSCQNQQSQIFQFNRQTPSSREITRTLDVMRSTHMQTVLEVTHFKSVHERVKVKLNSVDITKFNQGVLATDNNELYTYSQIQLVWVNSINCMMCVFVGYYEIQKLQGM